MAKILREGIHSAEFVVWEAHSYYTRANAWIDAEDDHPVGQPYRKLKSNGELSPITAANVDSLSPTTTGAGDEAVTVPAIAEFFGFLIDEVVGEETDGATVQRAFLVEGPATINPAHINFPVGANTGATAALKAAILGFAADKGIKVA